MKFSEFLKKENNPTTKAKKSLPFSEQIKKLDIEEPQELEDYQEPENIAEEPDNALLSATKKTANLATAGILNTATSFVGSSFDTLLSGGAWVENNVLAKGWSKVSSLVGNERMAKNFSDKGEKNYKEARKTGIEVGNKFSEAGDYFYDTLVRDNPNFIENKNGYDELMEKRREEGTDKDFHIEDLVSADRWINNFAPSLTKSLGLIMTNIAIAKGRGIPGILAGTGVSVGMESIMEGEQKYKEVIDNEGTVDDAIRQADNVVKRNIVGITFSNLFETIVLQKITGGASGGAVASGLKKLAYGAGNLALNVAEERGQSLIQDKSDIDNLGMEDYLDFIDTVTKLELTDDDLNALAVAGGTTAGVYVTAKADKVYDKIKGKFGNEEAIKVKQGISKIVKESGKSSVEFFKNRIPKRKIKEAEESLKENDTPVSDENIVNEVFSSSPEVVEEILEDSSKQAEFSSGADKVFNTNKESAIEAEDLLSSGLSELEVKQRISQTVGVDSAIDIVDRVVENREEAGEKTEITPEEQKPATRMEKIVNQTLETVPKKETVDLPKKENNKKIENDKNESKTKEEKSEKEESRREDVIKGNYKTEEELKFYLKNSKVNAGLASITKIQRKLEIGKTQATEIYNRLQKENYILSEKEQDNINDNRLIEKRNRKKSLEALSEGFKGNTEESKKILDSMEETKEFGSEDKKEENISAVEGRRVLYGANIKKKIEDTVSENNIDIASFETPSKFREEIEKYIDRDKLSDDDKILFPVNTGSIHFHATKEKKTNNQKESLKKEGNTISKEEDVTVTTDNQNVGEKIGGSAKDKRSKDSQKYESDLSNSDIANLPLSKTVPELDYKNLVETGTPEYLVKLFIYKRSNLARKPNKTSYKIDKWVEQVEIVRTMGKLLFDSNHETIANDFTMKIQGLMGLESKDYKLSEVIEEVPEIKATFNLWDNLDYLNDPNIRKITIARIGKLEKRVKKIYDKDMKVVDTNSLEEGFYYFLHKNGKHIETLEIRGNDDFINVYTKQYNKEQTGEVQNEKKQKKSFKDKLGIYAKKRVVKGEKPYSVKFKQGAKEYSFNKFETLQEARDSIKDPDLVDKWEKEFFESTSFDSNSFRNIAEKVDKKNYREGDRNVDAEEFKNTFGFRGVEFGTYLNQKDRAVRLNSVYDSFKELAGILNIPEKAISLNGELAFAFASRGSKGAVAHYEPNKVVINITKSGGAGSIAHEWWHALDNYLIRRSTGDKQSFMSHVPSKYDRKELSEAMLGVTKSITESDVLKRSAVADKNKGKKYYTVVTELGARAFEVYINQKLKDNNTFNDYLVSIKSFEETENMFKSSYPYAKGEEITPIMSKLDTFFETIQVEDPEGSAILYKEKQAEVQTEITESFLTDVKKRLNFDFDVKYVDTILSRSGKKAWGMSYDNEIAILKNLTDTTEHHEVVHLTLKNLKKIKSLKGFDRTEILKAQAREMGVEYKKRKEREIEEQLARDFEKYVVKGVEPKSSMLVKFFKRLRRLLRQFSHALRGTNGDLITQYFDTLLYANDVSKKVTRLKNNGLLDSFIKNGVLSMKGATGIIKDDVKNKKNKESYKEQDSFLTTEARKYESAEEFVESRLPKKKTISGDIEKIGTIKLKDLVDFPLLRKKFGNDFDDVYITPSSSKASGGIFAGDKNSMFISKKVFDIEYGTNKVLTDKRIAIEKKIESDYGLEAKETDLPKKLVDEYRKSILDENESSIAISFKLSDDGVKAVAHELEHLKQSRKGQDGTYKPLEDLQKDEFYQDNKKLFKDDEYYGKDIEIEARRRESTIKTESELREVWQEAQEEVKDSEIMFSLKDEKSDFKMYKANHNSAVRKLSNLGSSLESMRNKLITRLGLRDLKETELNAVLEGDYKKLARNITRDGKISEAGLKKAKVLGIESKEATEKIEEYLRTREEYKAIKKITIDNKKNIAGLRKDVSGVKEYKKVVEKRTIFASQRLSELQKSINNASHFGREFTDSVEKQRVRKVREIISISKIAGQKLETLVEKTLQSSGDYSKMSDSEFVSFVDGLASMSKVAIEKEFSRQAVYKLIASKELSGIDNMVRDLKLGKIENMSKSNLQKLRNHMQKEKEGYYYPDRKDIQETLKKIHVKVKKATKTGRGVDVQFQKKLLNIFENYNLVKPTSKTIQRLKSLKSFIATIENEDVRLIPTKLKDKLSVLSNINIHDMEIKQQEELQKLIVDLYEAGVSVHKMKLRFSEELKQKRIKEVLSSTREIKESRLPKSLQKLKESIKKTTGRGNLVWVFNHLHSLRVGDIFDGSNEYRGENVKMIRQLQNAENNFNDEYDKVMIEKMSEIGKLKEEFSEDEQARLYYFALSDMKGTESQMEKLSEKHKWELPLVRTELENNVLDTVRESFTASEVRMSSIYETLENKPFGLQENYFPLKYERSEFAIEVNIEETFNLGSTRTEQGFTKSREDGVKKLVRKDFFGVFAEAVHDQLYYIHMQPELDNIKQVVNDSEYQNKLGEDGSTWWKNYISGVASGGSVKDRSSYLASTRLNITNAVLGWKISTIVIQPMAIFDAMALGASSETVGIKHSLLMLLDIAQTFTPFYGSKKVEEAMLESPDLRNRTAGLVELRELKKAKFVNNPTSRLGKIWKGYQENAFAGIQFADLRTAGASYSRFNKAFKEKGYNKEEASERASMYMSLSNADASISSRPNQLNSSELWKTLFTFQNFNLNRFGMVSYDIVGTTELEFKSVFRSTIAIAIIMASLNLEDELREFVYEVSTGRELPKDNRSFIEKGLGGLLAMVPYVGQTQQVQAINGWGYGGAGYNAPLASLFSKVVKAGERIYGDEEIRGITELTLALMQILGVKGSAQLEQTLKSEYLPTKSLFKKKDD